jgi:hypothetical protein
MHERIWARHIGNVYRSQRGKVGGEQQLSRDHLARRSARLAICCSMRLQEPVIWLERIRIRKIGPHPPAITVGFSGAR